MTDQVERWPEDDANAVDPLQRHNLERARADPEYFTQNRAWYRWAERELVKRDEDKQRAERLEASNAERLEALDSRDREHAADLQKREEEETKKRIARSEHLAKGVRRLVW